MLIKETIQRYLIYAAIACIAAFLGGIVVNRFSNSAIAELKAELESDKKASKKTISEYQALIDTLNMDIKTLENTSFEKKVQLAAIRKDRLKLNSKEPDVQVILDADSLVNELRKIYN